MKVGDIVEMVDVSHPSLDLLGIVIEIDVNMWGEEVTPSGVSVLWADGGSGTRSDGSSSALAAT